MSRYAQALHDLGVSDPNAVESLAPLLKSLYDASATLHRAVVPHGGTAHATLSRASASAHDPDAEEVLWVSVFDNMGLFNTRRQVHSGHQRTLFRYILRFHQASSFVTHLASRRAASTGADVVGAGGNQESTADPVVLSCPTQKDWTFGAQPTVVGPSAAAISLVRNLILMLDKVSNPAVLCRDLAAGSLLALHKHVFSTIYERGPGLPALSTVFEHDSQDAAANGNKATGDSSGAEGEARAGNNESEVVAGTASAGNGMDLDEEGAPYNQAAMDTSQSAPAQAAAQLFCSSQPSPALGPSLPTSTVPTSTALAAQQAAAPSTNLTPAPAANEAVSAGAGPAPAADGSSSPERNVAPSMDANEGATPPGANSAPADSAPHAALSTAQGTNMVSTPSAEEASAVQVSDKTIKMGKLMSHFKCTWWPSFKSSGSTKAIAPAGTGKNHKGCLTVRTWTTVWAHQVDISEVKGDIEATRWSQSPLYNKSALRDKVQVVGITNVCKKSVHAILGLLLLVCTKEKEITHILEEVLTSLMAGQVPYGMSAMLGGIVQVGQRSPVDNRGETSPAAGGSSAAQRSSPRPDGGSQRQGVGEMRGQSRRVDGESNSMSVSGMGSQGHSHRGNGGSSSTATLPPAPTGGGRTVRRSGPAGTSPGDGQRPTRLTSDRASRASRAGGPTPRASDGEPGGSDVLATGSAASAAAYYFRKLPESTLARRQRIEKRRIARQRLPRCPARVPTARQVHNRGRMSGGPAEERANDGAANGGCQGIASGTIDGGANGASGALMKGGVLNTRASTGGLSHDSYCAAGRTRARKDAAGGGRQTA